MTDKQTELMDNIEKYGCQVTSVFDPEGEEVDFTYTTGIYKKESQPELIIVGLRHKLAMSMANDYNRRIQSGKTFKNNTFYGDFLDKFKVIFCPVSDENKKEYLLESNRFYGGIDYPAVQLIYPTVKGVWPWEDKATNSFKILQPCLQENRVW